MIEYCVLASVRATSAALFNAVSALAVFLIIYKQAVAHCTSADDIRRGRYNAKEAPTTQCCRGLNALYKTT